LREKGWPNTTVNFADKRIRTAIALGAASSILRAVGTLVGQVSNAWAWCGRPDENER